MAYWLTFGVWVNFRAPISNLNWNIRYENYLRKKAISYNNLPILGQALVNNGVVMAPPLVTVNNNYTESRKVSLAYYKPF